LGLTRKWSWAPRAARHGEGARGGGERPPRRRGNQRRGEVGEAVRQGEAAVLVARGCCGGRRLAGDLNSGDLLCVFDLVV
jgi:hypothetical protein